MEHFQCDTYICKNWTIREVQDKKPYRKKQATQSIKKKRSCKWFSNLYQHILFDLRDNVSPYFQLDGNPFILKLQTVQSISNSKNPTAQICNKGKNLLSPSRGLRDQRGPKSLKFTLQEPMRVTVCEKWLASLTMRNSRLGTLVHRKVLKEEIPQYIISIAYEG